MDVSLAEFGSFMLEWHALSVRTGDLAYGQLADELVSALAQRYPEQVGTPQAAPSTVACSMHAWPSTRAGNTLGAASLGSSQHCILNLLGTGALTGAPAGVVQPSHGPAQPWQHHHRGGPGGLLL